MRLQLAILVFIVLVGEFVWGKPTGNNQNCNQNIDFDAEFSNFIQRYNLNYSDDYEQQYRFGVFVQNYLNMQKYQSQAGDGVQFGVTRFMDWTLDEKKALVPLNLNNTVFNNSNIIPLQPSSNRVKRQAVPTSFDWSAQGKVSPVKDQGSCGCCWAFAATGVLESQYAIYRNVTFLDLSEQEIINCETQGVYGTDSGCDGGLPINALYYTSLYGDSSEAADPYTEVQGTCTQPTAGGRTYIDYCFYATDYDASGDPLYNFDEETTAEILAEIGPLAHHIYVPESFYYYVSGVYHPSADECANNIGGHAITAVGYGVDAASGNPYWFLKNQWGTDWGMNGYFMLYRGDATCSMGIPMAGATWFDTTTTQGPDDEATTKPNVAPTITTPTPTIPTTTTPPLSYCCANRDALIIQNSPNTSVLVQSFFSSYTSKGTTSTYPFKWGPTMWNQWAAILNTNIVPIIGNTSLTNAQKHEQIYDLSVNFINVKLASNKSIALCVPDVGFGYFGDYLQCQVNTGVSAAPSFSLRCADWFNTSMATWSLPAFPCSQG